MYAALEYLGALHRHRRARARARGLRAELDHVALGARDALRLARFYTEVVGLAPVNLPAFEAGEAPFPSARVSPATILDFLPAEAPPVEGGAPPGPGHVCLAVAKPDFDALVTRLAKHDVPTEGPPELLSGARGDGWAVYARDPEGNRVEFRWYP